MLASTCSMRLVSLATVEVLVAGVDGLGPLPVDGDDGPGEQESEELVGRGATDLRAGHTE